MLIMLESLNYSFRNPKHIISVIYRIKQLRNYKKTMGSSEDPSLVNNVDELGLVRILRVKQRHVCAIRVAQLLRVELSIGASAVADIIVVRPWLDHLELSNQIVSVVIWSWLRPLNCDLAFSPPRRVIEYIWVTWFPEPRSGKPCETYERDISIKSRRKKGTFDLDYPKSFLCKIRKKQGRKIIPKT